MSLAAPTAQKVAGGAHPRDVLLGAQGSGIQLPVCDHYSGVEVRMRKSLQLQAALIAEMGYCVMDVTLDCEDGAAVGAEAQQAQAVTELLHEFALARNAAQPAAPPSHFHARGPPLAGSRSWRPRRQQRRQQQRPVPLAAAAAA